MKKLKTYDQLLEENKELLEALKSITETISDTLIYNSDLWDKARNAITNATK